MTSSLLPFVAVVTVLLASAATVLARTVPKDDATDVTGGIPETLRRHFLPVFISPAALEAALRAEAEIEEEGASAGDFDNVLLAQRKRGFESPYYSSRSLPSSASSSRGSKRKMFWQPLGYMSASARRQNQAKIIPERGDSSDSGSNLFRYG